MQSEDVPIFSSMNLSTKELRSLGYSCGVGGMDTTGFALAPSPIAKAASGTVLPNLVVGPSRACKHPRVCHCAGL